MFAVGHKVLAIDEHIIVAVSFLNVTAGTGGEVVHEIRTVKPQTIEIDNIDIRLGSRC